jgi:hypothetical protein
MSTALMDSGDFLLDNNIRIKQAFIGVVLHVHAHLIVLVGCQGEESGELLCDVLQTSNGSGLRLAVGDNVLVWLPGDEQERGIVLGRIGPSRAPDSKQEGTPDEVVIEAKKNLTFKCGEGSITLRKDGKILIKGKDLVSQARRVNRIKGGAVTIN